MSRRLLDRLLPLIPVVVPSAPRKQKFFALACISIRFDSISKGRHYRTRRPPSPPLLARVKAPTIWADTLAETPFRESFPRLTCARSQQNAYANYHFPRSSKRRCYYCSYLTDEISKTLRYTFMYVTCARARCLSESVSRRTRLPQNNYCFIGKDRMHFLAIVPRSYRAAIFPVFLLVCMYVCVCTRVYTTRREIRPGTLSKRSLFKNMAI